ncbi:MAG: hypothetical protein B7Z55_03490 [Planctomycetales bacterium 12-60-4]|nr:MAG: hypothetical protein B7Z55_03490 [Planctomycetales bacterium 12-60-4]
MQELRGLEEKQPYHYFALALLEDALPDREPLTFLKWLLKGLQRWPRDPGLCELLVNTLRQDVKPEQAASFLKAIAKVIRDDRFFYLTEGLWDLHLRHAQFHEFRATLKACEAHLVDHRITARLAFYIHILKPAMWLADDDWIDEVLNIINSEGARLAWRFEGDLELLFQLREYIQTRYDILDGDGIRQEMDAVIRSYCLDAEPEFDSKFLNCTRCSQPFPRVYTWIVMAPCIGSGCGSTRRSPTVTELPVMRRKHRSSSSRRAVSSGGFRNFPTAPASAASGQ